MLRDVGYDSSHKCIYTCILGDTCIFGIWTKQVCIVPNYIHHPSPRAMRWMGLLRDSIQTAGSNAHVQTIYIYIYIKPLLEDLKTLHSSNDILISPRKLWRLCCCDWELDYHTWMEKQDWRGYVGTLLNSCYILSYVYNTYQLSIPYIVSAQLQWENDIRVRCKL